MPSTDPAGPSPTPASGAGDRGSADLAGPSGPPDTALLRQILDEARDAGFLGPGPLDVHLRHAAGFGSVCRRLWPDGPAPPVLLDLGSGAGLPGFVVALGWPEATLTLLDANGRRTAFLSAAVRRLGLEGRVSVVQARAELAGRDPGLRERFDGVLARSFGRPAVVAECAAPLLRRGGWLVVSEPPGGPESRQEATLRSPAPAPAPSRWPPEPLAQLGLEPGELVYEGFDYQTLRQVRPCPERFPRRDGMPTKRPLF